MSESVSRKKKTEKNQYFFPVKSYPFWLTFLKENETELANKCFTLFFVMMFHPFFVMNSKYLETHTFSIYFHEFVWRISVQFCFLSDCRSTKSKISRSIFLNCNSQQNVFEFGLIWISLRVLFIIFVKSIWIFTRS